jgi:hypothetical protein
MRVTRCFTALGERTWIPLPPDFQPVAVVGVDDPRCVQDAFTIVWDGDRPVMVPVACGPAAPYPARPFDPGRWVRW